MIANTEEFTRRIEQAIENIGKEHAKILAAQICSLVQEIRQGNLERTYLLWEAVNAPVHIKELVSRKCFFAEWVLYVPEELDIPKAPMFAALERIVIDLPSSGSLVVFRQPI